ncbi:hypothetical protein [Pelagovum pacificum]|nr:hypothetical protein [Pelagovum pacificum]
MRLSIDDLLLTVEDSETRIAAEDLRLRITLDGHEAFGESSILI